jgi:glycerophosphoryl diester phosphodiesterase
MLVSRLSGTPERLPTPYFALPAPMVIAHQGGNGLRPGNTLLAFDYALALGVDVLEMDVHLSRDGQVVVMHDATVDRTTNGNGALADLDLADIRELDAAYHWPFDSDDKQFRGQAVQIPTLPEVVQRYPGHRLLLELKTPQPELANAVCEILRSHQQAPLTMVASFHQQALEAFRKACPTVATSASSDEVQSFMFFRNVGLSRLFIAPAIALQVAKVRDGVDLLNDDFVKDADELSLFVDFWTLNDVADMRMAEKIGAQGIITDRPDLLLSELGRI